MLKPAKLEIEYDKQINTIMFFTVQVDLSLERLF